MIERKKQIQQISTLLGKEKIEQGNPPAAIIQLSGDGSDRVFYRVSFASGFSLIAAFPAATPANGADEQRASFRIGVHLYDKGVPVPEIYAYDSWNTLIFFEDLGDVHLHAMVRKAAGFDDVEYLYRQAIDALVLLQVEGCSHFDTSFCWDTPRYDEELMLTRESGYFATAFCRDYMGKIADDHRVDAEFHKLARRAAEEPADFLLHRDFQSRNLLVHDDRVRIIDYQGARFGPLGYDPASLLIDPYAGLTCESRERLLVYYMQRIAERVPMNRERFLQGYYCLALQRNLQILGAFAFLHQKKGKVFFERFILPAVLSLARMLHEPQGKDYPVLAGLVEELREKLEKAQFIQMDDEL